MIIGDGSLHVWSRELEYDFRLFYFSNVDLITSYSECNVGLYDADS